MSEQDIATHMSDDLETWRRGYQQAIDTLRQIGNATENEQLNEVVGVLAAMLEETKP